MLRSFSGDRLAVESEHASRLQKFDAAVARRKSKTLFVNERQRAELREFCAVIDADLDCTTIAAKVRGIRDDNAYLAAAGSLQEFCTEFVGLEEAAAQDFLAQLDESSPSVVESALAHQVPMVHGAKTMDTSVNPAGTPAANATLHPDKSTRVQDAKTKNVARISAPGVIGGRAEPTIPLTAAEQAELAECEAVVKRLWPSFLQVGEALLRIRDRRLYRGNHETFEAFCREKFRFSRPHASRLLNAASVVQALAQEERWKPLSPTGDMMLPDSERQVRALLTIESKDRPAAWLQAVELAGGGPVTAPLPKEALAPFKKTVVRRSRSRLTPMAPIANGKLLRLLAVTERAVRDGDSKDIVLVHLSKMRRAFEAAGQSRTRQRKAQVGRPPRAGLPGVSL
jgi:hypothetical protein